VRETDAGARLTVDHFQSLSRGGTDDEENLVYSCHACNEYKGNVWQPEAESRILHPLRDDRLVHIQEASDFRLIGLTPTGIYHIQQLRLNREELIVHRQRRRKANEDRLEQELLLVTLRRMEAEIEDLIRRVSEQRRDEL
jgi:hypothetical protein